MNINATLLGQMITFVLFVWFTKRFVWPPINKALVDRQDKIADGLAAAEKVMQNLKERKKFLRAKLKKAKKKHQK